MKKNGFELLVRVVLRFSRRKRKKRMATVCCRALCVVKWYEVSRVLSVSSTLVTTKSYRNVSVDIHYSYMPGLHVYIVQYVLERFVNTLYYTFQRLRSVKNCKFFLPVKSNVFATDVELTLRFKVICFFIS